MLREIETASRHFKSCPKCSSSGGFWLGLRREKAYVQCKECGSKFELFEVYRIGEGTKPPRRLSLFRR